ncbi:MAG: PHP domain-containing protein [Clostridiales bacterium]|nr:PHP domain-containing protein [Clostridiales bacterium]
MENQYREIADRYEMIYDLHTHTTYSHGKGSVEDNVRKGIERGLEYIAISDHGPGHLFYGINRNEIVNIRNDIERMNAKYPKTHVKISVEANIIRGGAGLDIKPEEFEEFDFIIAGYHYGLFGCSCVRNWLWSKGLKLGEAGLRRSNTEMVINALRENDISILTHPGDKGPFDIEEIARVCVETDTLMEINTWHGHLTEEEIRIASQVEKVGFIISSDAHTPGRVGDFKEGVERALRAGLDLKRIVNIKEKK